MKRVVDREDEDPRAAHRHLAGRVRVACLLGSILELESDGKLGKGHPHVDALLEQRRLCVQGTV